MIEFRPLHVDDDLTAFQSGDPDLDRFLKQFAGQNQFRLHIGTTYVATEATRILGYVTVAATSIAIDSIPHQERRKLPRYPLPALRLARMAVDHSAQGRGIGRKLLKLVCELAREMSVRYGCVGIVVDAKPPAVEFYRRYGFQEIDVLVGDLATRPSPLPMFLPIGSIADRSIS